MQYQLVSYIDLLNYVAAIINLHVSSLKYKWNTVFGNYNNLFFYFGRHEMYNASATHHGVRKC